MPKEEDMNSELIRFWDGHGYYVSQSWRRVVKGKNKGKYRIKRRGRIYYAKEITRLEGHEGA